MKSDAETTAATPAPLPKDRWKQAARWVQSPEYHHQQQEESTTGEIDADDLLLDSAKDFAKVGEGAGQGAPGGGEEEESADGVIGGSVVGGSVGVGGGGGDKPISGRRFRAAATGGIRGTPPWTNTNSRTSGTGSRAPFRGRSRTAKPWQAHQERVLWRRLPTRLPTRAAKQRKRPKQWAASPAVTPGAEKKISSKATDYPPTLSAT